MSKLDQAIEHIREGNTAEARPILEELLDVDESNEEVWLWLSSVVDTEEDREICLENVLALDPDNVVALRGLEALRSGAFDPDDLVAELLQDEDKTVEPPSTFIDDFVLADDDEDYLFAEPEQPKRKKVALGPKRNVIIIAVLVLVLLGVMTSLGLAAMFMMDGDGSNGILPGQETTGQETPVEAQATAEPTQTPTSTHTPTATHTPTPTSTPLQLPTQRPTDLPTPTATRVVSPTPIK